MEKHWDILVVSARLENRRELLRILEGLPVNAFTASNVQQALEVLSSHAIRLMFCEENFADGSYRELLAVVRTAQTKTPLVLMLSTGEWDEYLEAMSLGATEVVRCPLQPTDVELTLICAAREDEAQIHGSLEKRPTNPRASGAVSCTLDQNVPG